MITNFDELGDYIDERERLVKLNQGNPIPEVSKAIEELTNEINLYIRLVERDGIPQMQYLDDLGWFLVATRIWKKISQQDFASQIHLTYEMLKQYERLKWATAPLATVFQAIERLDVDLTASTSIHRFVIHKLKEEQDSGLVERLKRSERINYLEAKIDDFNG